MKQALEHRPRTAWLALTLVLGAPPLAAAPRDARTLYNGKCALCHGRDGRSNPALAAAKVRNFDDAAWQKERTDEQLRAAIADGKDRTLMRAFEGELSAEEIAGLVKVIRAFAPREPKGSPPPK